MKFLATRNMTELYSKTTQQLSPQEILFHTSQQRQFAPINTYYLHPSSRFPHYVCVCVREKAKMSKFLI